MSAVRKRLVLCIAVVFVLAGVSPQLHAGIININALSANSVDLVLQAGSYSAEVVGVDSGGDFDAWNPWHYWSADGFACNENGGQCLIGWVNAYRISAEELGELILGDGQRYATADLALYNAENAYFTLAQESVVSFFIADLPRWYWDNGGGISLDLKSLSVPEPGAGILMLIGFFGLLLSRKLA